MLKKKVQYIDFNDEEAEKTLYFNLTEVEAVRLDAKMGGLSTIIQHLDSEKDPETILNLFETVIKASYGVKTPDGLSFEKTEAATSQFMSSPEYSAFFMELMRDSEFATSFFNELFERATKGLQSLAN